MTYAACGVVVLLIVGVCIAAVRWWMPEIGP